ncbi:MAG: class I SAM-dependent methyltransferase [Ruminococcus sp.]|nr:class I SAM-dependent methyltransferase [Ruminococcus sp.]
MSEKRDFRFDKKAEKYDDSYEGKLSEKFYTLVIENVELTDGMEVLEMGCGTGTILHRLSQRCSISGHGIDVEEKMLEQARKKCPDMEILNCSCDDTPFEDGRFDVIVACMAYHHFPDKDGFSKECARLLKQGGRLYIADPKLPLPIRKVLNTALDIHKIHGRIYTADEMTENFTGYGFGKVFDKSDAYAQIICLERI